jgi:hypothetical protein
LILTPMKEAIYAHVLDPAFYHDDLIRYVALGEDTGLMGAAAYARERV